MDQGRELLHLISEGFIFVDPDFRVLEINQVGLRMSGRPRSDYIGNSFWDVTGELKGSKLGPLLIRAMRNGTPISAEHLYTWVDNGRQSWLEVRGHPTAGGMAIFYRDVSDRKRSEEELKRAQAELMHASRLSAMGTMAATLAHELAQPLTSAGNAIDASIRMLRSLPGSQTRETQHALRLAGTSIRRASEILKRLRNFVTKGRVRAKTQDIQAIIADASVLVFPQAQREGVEIRFRLDRQARWVKADAVQIQQVLINLVKNAIEAMAESEERRITISTAAVSPGFVQVAVEDSGPGLDSSSGEALFAPFHSTKEGGLGVGLSVSRTIVEAHGGTIEAARAAGGGALFRFTLPRGSGPG